MRAYTYSEALVVMVAFAEWLQLDQQPLKARIAELAQEQATSDEAHRRWRGWCVFCWADVTTHEMSDDEQRRAICAAYDAKADEAKAAEAALGETRQALQQAHAVIVELNTLDFSDELQARVDAVLIACQNPECKPAR